MEIQKKLNQLGIVLETDTGHIFYAPNFKPMELNVELILIRHGETFGNCGQTTQQGDIHDELVKTEVKDAAKRVYQGNVDKAINQLTQLGKRQALHAAIKLEVSFLQKKWIPDLVLHSPLARAKDTGIPFIIRNGLEHRYLPCPGIQEMSFGAWENRRVCDIDPAHRCHAFYLDQDALVKESGLDCHGLYQEGESFCDVLLRAHNTLSRLNEEYVNKKMVLFSHSMFGAACAILTGKGQRIENGNYLAFDGKKKDGSSYALTHAEPFCLF